MALPLPQYLLGRNGKAYYNNAAGLITPTVGQTVDQAIQTWLALATTVAAGNMTDVRYNVSSTFADGTTRETASTGFETQIAVMRGGQITFDARWRPGALLSPVAPFEFGYVLLNAWRNDTTLAMGFFDIPKDYNPGPATTIVFQGLAGNFSVSVEKQENLRDVQRASITLSLSDSGTWYRDQIAGS